MNSIHVYGSKSEYIVIPLKNLDAQNFYKAPILGTQFLNPGSDSVSRYEWVKRKLTAESLEVAIFNPGSHLKKQHAFIITL